MGGAARLNSRSSLDYWNAGIEFNGFKHLSHQFSHRMGSAGCDNEIIGFRKVHDTSEGIDEVRGVAPINNGLRIADLNTIP